jgi:hypothetical protein
MKNAVQYIFGERRFWVVNGLWGVVNGEFVAILGR